MNIGIQDGLIDPHHADRMEEAVWLYLWCVKCQTKRNGGTFVLGGMPLTYNEIARRSGFAARRVRRWLNKLRKFNYVKVTYLNYMMMKIEITKAKKWDVKQSNFAFSPRPQTVNSIPSTLTANGQPLRPYTVNGSTVDGQPKQKCSLSNIRIKDPRGSAARAFYRDRRLAREAEVKGELHVGTYPGPQRAEPTYCAICGHVKNFHQIMLVNKLRHDPRWIEHEFVERKNATQRTG
jgi:hypothetical protein